MTNTAAAILIAERLPHGLPHPGNPAKNQPAKLIPLPAFRSTGIPPDMAKHFADQAGFPASDATTVIAEAIVNLLETDGGFTIIPTSELDALRQAAADAPDGIRVISLRCSAHNTELLHLSVGKTDQVKIPCKLLATAIGAHQAGA